MKNLALVIFLKLFILADNCGPVVRLPIVINTWGFYNATIAAYEALDIQDASAVSSSVIDSFITADKIIFFRSMPLLKAALFVKESNVTEPSALAEVQMKMVRPASMR